MAHIPLMVNFKGKHIVVVGGGRIAARRINNLLESDATITVISPKVNEEIASLFHKKKIVWMPKNFSDDDLSKADLIIAATDKEAINKAVVEAAPSNSLVNAAGDSATGNVHFPAQFKRGKLTIAVSTNGASPLLAKRVTGELAGRFTEDYEFYLEFLFEAREILKKSNLSIQTRNQYLRKFLEETYLDTSVQDRTLDWLRSL
ncbi:NAD(P)-binding protein [Sediminibacillus massiliensis]|uniref:NAD(P)-binding protein n=1 Tax=Sediminibacillus massiliensis TaxID=1926277 RepID=UPI0009884845|nr:NAD(P)-binding protein [Sediminibacillus massiliensis]